MCIFKALGKTLEGSGFEEIVLESGMCSSGSMNGVMTLKHYNRAMTVHKVFLEAMERLLMKQFLIKTVPSAKWNRLKSTSIDLEINPQNVEDSCKIDELLSLFHDYENERSDLRNGKKVFFTTVLDSTSR